MIYAKIALGFPPMETGRDSSMISLTVSGSYISKLTVAAACR
jgi:hypothetical protein